MRKTEEVEEFLISILKCESIGGIGNSSVDKMLDVQRWETEFNPKTLHKSRCLESQFVQWHERWRQDNIQLTWWMHEKETISNSGKSEKQEWRLSSDTHSVMLSCTYTEANLEKMWIF